MASQVVSGGRVASSALDQLQREINTVLEHTGRVFAAVNQNGSTAAVAQASRLKKVYPVALDRYHKALDELEDELRMAALVFRRDLALCREKNAVAEPEPVPEPVPAPAVTDVKQPSPQDSSRQNAEPPASVPDEDHLMTDATSPAENATTSKSPTNEGFKPQQDTKDKQAPSQPQPSDAIAKQEEEAPNSKPPSPLQIDTSNPAGADSSDARPKSNDSNKPPDTADAFSANADLDSLFNDTNSAAGGDGAGDGLDFNTAGGSDFDFDSFNTLGDGNNDGGNDLSSLLPGLEQYANNPSPGGDHDFNALFNTDGDGNGGEKGQNQDMGALEDFMDFADLSGGNGNGNDNGDIDFSFDFS